MPYLELAEVSKDLGGRRVLDRVSLTLAKGELLGLLGPSGSGKTTILNILGGFLAPEEGRVRIDGADILSLPPHRRDIGITFQGYALFPHMDVFGNVAYGLQQRQVGKAETRARVTTMLEMLGLSGFEARYPRSLSGGQQQRVALARALVVRPRLMLLDEPLANLDASLRQRIRFEIREVLRRTEVTSVFVTHDQDEAFSLCDRVAILNEGRIQQVGSASELIGAPANPFVAAFIGDPNIFGATVTAAGGGLAEFIVGGFAGRARAPTALAPGSAVSVFVRPEVIAIDPAGAGPAFEVKDVIHLVGNRELLLDGPVRLRVRVRDDHRPVARGDQVAPRWPAELAHAMPAAPP